MSAIRANNPASSTLALSLMGGTAPSSVPSSSVRGTSVDTYSLATPGTGGPAHCDRRRSFRWLRRPGPHPWAGAPAAHVHSRTPRACRISSARQPAQPQSRLVRAAVRRCRPGSHLAHGRDRLLRGAAHRLLPPRRAARARDTRAAGGDAPAPGARVGSRRAQWPQAPLKACDARLSKGSTIRAGASGAVADARAPTNRATARPVVLGSGLARTDGLTASWLQTGRQRRSGGLLVAVLFPARLT
jgi:hypothetical protein